MTWDDGAPTLGAVFTPAPGGAAGAGAPAGRGAHAAPQGPRRLAAAGLRGALLRPRAGAGQDRAGRDAAGARRRLRHELARQRQGCSTETDVEEVYIQAAAGDAGTALGAALYVAPCRCAARRATASSWSTATGDRRYDEPRDPAGDRRAHPRARAGGTGAAARSTDRDRRRRGPAGGGDRRGDRPRRGRRLVPGTLGVGTARARQPLDPRRSAAAGHEGAPQSKDQAPRVVPPLRPVDPGGADGRLVHPRPIPTRS